MANPNWYKWLMISAMSLTVVGCNNDDDPEPETKKLKLNITGLPKLGAAHAYEGWIIVDGEAVSTGTFSVYDNGLLSRTAFNVDTKDLNEASAFVLTIEPKPDSDPDPSDIHVLAGDFSGASSTLSISHASAIGNDFGSAAGKYILATPTNGMNTNEKSGVWFLNPGATPTAALSLPALPSGWKYEGWAVINNIPVTTGKFTMPSGADESAPFSGPMDGPPFPGEDYLMNAPTGLTFPTDLSGQTIVITIEPNPDNSDKPFSIKPLSGDVPAAAMEGTSYNLMNTIATGSPGGTATR